jgi:hypothetical protein
MGGGEDEGRRTLRTDAWCTDLAARNLEVDGRCGCDATEMGKDGGWMGEGRKNGLGGGGGAQRWQCDI